MSSVHSEPAQRLVCAGRSVDLSRPRVMGILNVTPDSFSDGGRYFADIDRARARAEAMIAAGADFIDIGGESTRPGAAPVGVSEELDRVVPVVEMVASEFDVIVSVDTSKPEVMRESARVGAGLLNDVRALQESGALAAAAETGLPVCLMHMQGAPGSMQNSPHYDDVVAEVLVFLRARIAACETAGIERSRIIADPGFGFGKTPEHNLQLLNRMAMLQSLNCPILAGLSRKSLLGAITGRPVEQRGVASAVAAALAVHGGARIIRSHDVAETVDAVKVAWATTREALDG